MTIKPPPEDSDQINNSKSLYRFRLTSSADPSLTASPLEPPEFSTPLSYRLTRKTPELFAQPTIPVPKSSSSDKLTYRFSIPTANSSPSITSVPETLDHTPKGILVLLLLILPFLVLFGLSWSFSPQTSTVSLSEIRSKNESTIGDYKLIVTRANDLVNRNELKFALKLLADIPEAAPERDRIAAEMVNRARNAYPNNLELAAYIVSVVPSDTEVYSTARSLYQQWQPQVDQIRAAESALSQWQWSDAANQIRGLQGTEIEQTDRFKRIIEQINSSGR